METILYIFAKIIQIILSVVSFAMLVRALLPIFIEPEDNRFYFFACLLTEPFVAPVRFLMVKMNIGQDSPIDWAFFVTYMLIGMLEIMLPVI